jgi:TPP-dependent pyruvate/acetoin dehydrogenase alpha subunit
MPGETVDGMDVRAVEAAVRRAVDSVRAGNGPQLLELRTYRFRAHSMYDAELYRGKEEVERWKERDPLTTFATQLRAESALTDADQTNAEREVAAEVAEAVAFAESGAWEPVEDLLKDVHTPEVPR